MVLRFYSYEAYVIQKDSNDNKSIRRTYLLNNERKEKKNHAKKNYKSAMIESHDNMYMTEVIKWFLESKQSICTPETQLLQ